MKLEGSCHCQAVRFSLRSKHPYPFNLCYCTICRKTAGSGGYAINLSGDAATLEIEGRENLSVYQARQVDSASLTITQSPAQRSFCKICGATSGQLRLSPPHYRQPVHHKEADETRWEADIRSRTVVLLQESGCSLWQPGTAADSQNRAFAIYGK